MLGIKPWTSYINASKCSAPKLHLYVTVSSSPVLRFKPLGLPLALQLLGANNFLLLQDSGSFYSGLLLLIFSPLISPFQCTFCFLLELRMLFKKEIMYKVSIWHKPKKNKALIIEFGAKDSLKRDAILEGEGVWVSLSALKSNIKTHHINLIFFSRHLLGAW